MDSSGSQEKKAIPRFASFKPKSTAPPLELDPSRERERRHRETTDGDQGSRHQPRLKGHLDRSRSRERRTERRERRHAHRSEDHAAARVAPESVPVSRPVVKEEIQEVPDLYFVDRKGDRYNITYGTLHRYSVPQYHRIGRGSVLGLPRGYKIDRDTTEGDALVIRTDNWRTDATRTKSKAILSKLNKQRTKLLRVRREITAETADASKDFLPFKASGDRHHRGSAGDIDTDDDRYAYRSIRGKAKPEDDLPSDFEAVSATESSGDEGFRLQLDEEAKQLNAELNRAVEKTPHDVHAWLRLIDHQHTLMVGAGAESRPLSYAEQKSLADIRLSLYEKALKKIGQAASRDRLLIGRLEEGAKLWDTKKLSAQWQAVLKSNPQFISLWVKYLDFRQTEFLDFTYERCLATFIECMKLNASTADSAEKAYIQIYLFLRMTLFMREAGFSEHAVGLWQAVLEFTFFLPGGLQQSNDREKALSAFIDFWDSEVARIGEVGAKGWRSGSSSPIEPRVTTSKCRIDSRSLFGSWSTCERERIGGARLPARTLDESDEDDPFRIVLSSDFEEILSLFWEFNATHVLIDSFLYFCHLPPLVSQSNTETTRRWAGDNFLRNDLIDNPDLTFDEWLLRPDDLSSTTPPLSLPHHNLIHTLDTLFANQQSWFSSFQLWRKVTLEGRSDIDPDWARRVLRLLVEANPTNDDLAEYSLAVEYVCNSKDAKKYAKSLLKKRSSNLRLYNAYALTERRSDNHAVAEHVWATALSMSQGFAARDKADSVLLWRTWIWECLETQDMARASHLLHAMPQNSVDLNSFPESSDQVVFSPASLLKIRSSLAEDQENALSTRNTNLFTASTDCLAILSYLTHSSDLTKALETYTVAISKLTTLPPPTEPFTSFTTELLHQSRAKLIYHHMRTSGVYKPSQIRTILAESISLFPHNTTFLSLFAWNESRFRIEERVRGLIRDITTTNPSSSPDTTQQVPITSHLFSIYTELLRPVYAGSTLHSVRAAFDRAVGDLPPPPSSSPSSSSSQDPRRSSNLTLWKLYILFELSRGDVSRAKAVFYRAMRACPWSKELLMLAFTHLADEAVRGRAEAGMGFEELRRVYNVLVEKGLRVHVDIEEMLDAMERDGDDGFYAIKTPGLLRMPVDAEGDDDLLG